MDEYTDAALDAAARERDPARRLELLSELERHLFEDEMPLIPICQIVDIHMYDPEHVYGLTSHPRQIQYLWRVGTGDTSRSPSRIAAP